MIKKRYNYNNKIIDMFTSIYRHYYDDINNYIVMDNEHYIGVFTNECIVSEEGVSVKGRFIFRKGKLLGMYSVDKNHIIEELSKYYLVKVEDKFYKCSFIMIALNILLRDNVNYIDVWIISDGVLGLGNSNGFIVISNYPTICTTDSIEYEKIFCYKYEEKEEEECNVNISLDVVEKWLNEILS